MNSRAADFGQMRASSDEALAKLVNDRGEMLALGTALPLAGSCVAALGRLRVRNVVPWPLVNDGLALRNERPAAVFEPLDDDMRDMPVRAASFSRPLPVALNMATVDRDACMEAERVSERPSVSGRRAPCTCKRGRWRRRKERRKAA